MLRRRMRRPSWPATSKRRELPPRRRWPVTRRDLRPNLGGHARASLRGSVSESSPRVRLLQCAKRSAAIAEGAISLLGLRRSPPWPASRHSRRASSLAINGNAELPVLNPEWQDGLQALPDSSKCTRSSLRGSARFQLESFRPGRQSKQVLSTWPGGSVGPRTTKARTMASSERRGARSLDRACSESFLCDLIVTMRTSTGSAMCMLRDQETTGTSSDLRIFPTSNLKLAPRYRGGAPRHLHCQWQAST